MSKRFTDTEKWRDPWFCGLSTPEKLFWVHICDTCNIAGIWQVNWPLVRFHIPDFEFKPEVFLGRIQILSGDKWHIKKFTDFQYGTLQQTNRLHQRIIFGLKKEGVLTPLPRGMDTPMDMDKDKDMDKDNTKGRPTIELVRAYCLDRGSSVDPDKFFHFYESKGWMVGKNKMKNWKSAIATWEKGDGENKPQKEVIG